MLNQYLFGTKARPSNIIVFGLFSLILIIKLCYFNYLLGFKMFHSPIYPILFLSIPSTVILINSVGLLICGKRQAMYLITINIILSLVMFGDVLYVRYFERPLSVWNIQQAGNLGWTLKAIMSIIQIRDIILFIDIPIGFVVIQLFCTSILQKHRIIAFMLMFCVGIFGFGFKPIRNYLLTGSVFVAVDETSNLILYNPVGFHLVEFINSFSFHKHKILNQKERLQIVNWFQNKNQHSFDVDSAYNNLQGVFKGMNLVLVQVESFGNNAVQRDFNNRAVTPFVDSLISHAIYFPNYHAQTSAGGTSDAEYLSLTSLYPVKKGSVFFRYPNNTYVSLPSLLKQQGYTTIAFHHNSKTFWNRADVYPKLGIDTLVDKDRFKDDSLLLSGKVDASIFRQTVKALEKTKQPFFALVITIESHLGEKWGGQNIGGYFSIMSEVDSALREFFVEIKNAGLLENTVFVIYGDHPPYLNRDKILAADPQAKMFFRQGRNVPLIIYRDGLQKMIVDKTGGQIDLLPTLAFLFDIDQNRFTQSAMGRNLFTTHKSFALLANGTLIRDHSNHTELDTVMISEGLNVSDLIVSSDFFRGPVSGK